MSNTATPSNIAPAVAKDSFYNKTYHEDDTWDRAIGVPLTAEQAARAYELLTVNSDCLVSRYSTFPVQSTSDTYAVMVLAPNISPVKIKVPDVTTDVFTYGKFGVVHTCSSLQEATAQAKLFVKNIDSSQRLVVVSVGKKYEFASNPTVLSLKGANYMSSVDQTDEDKKKLEKMIEDDAKDALTTNQSEEQDPYMEYFKLKIDEAKCISDLKSLFEKKKALEGKVPNIGEEYANHVCDDHPGLYVNHPIIRRTLEARKKKDTAVQNAQVEDRPTANKPCAGSSCPLPDY